jgi:hypothetical protein
VKSNKVSAGHSHAKQNEKHPAELKRLMSEPSFQEMWNRPFQAVTTLQVPDSGGCSVKADEYYLDEELVKQVKSGKISVPGMTPAQILQALLLHERVEKCLMDADNEIDIYEPAHEFATLAEHQFVRTFAPPYQYEHFLKPVIDLNETKRLTNVPPDLACSPYLDDPDKHDKAALAAMVALGVIDASKTSKEDVNYSRSTSKDRCDGCSHWKPEPGFTPGLARCELISGAVRDSRWCSKFEGMKDGQRLDSKGIGGQEQGGTPPLPGSPGGTENPGIQGQQGNALVQPQGAPPSQSG